MVRRESLEHHGKGGRTFFATSPEARSEDKRETRSAQRERLHVSSQLELAKIHATEWRMGAQRTALGSIFKLKL